MAGYQILGIRSFFDEKTRKNKKYDAFFEMRWRFDDIKEIFTHPAAVLDRCKVPEAERYNLYYTIATCDDTKRGFASGAIRPFDIDGIDISRREEYIQPVFDVLGLDPVKTVVVFSGNGLHFIIALEEPITDKAHFDEYRAQYHALCSKIDARLEELRLPGKADRGVFDAARILRIPGTLNRKADKLNPEKLIERMAEVIHPGDLSPQDFDLEKKSGLKKLDSSQAIPLNELKRYRRADGKAAMEECLFLKHVKEDAGSLNEPEWYAAASVVARFEKGRELFHEISKGHRGYNSAVTDDKLDQAVAASGPRTCSSIQNLWGKCRSCPHFEKITSPVVIFGKDVIPSEATGFYDILVNDKGVERRVPNYNDLLAAFKRDHPYKTIADMRSVFTFNGTHYVDSSPIEIKGYAERVMEPKPVDKIRSEFTHKVLANEIARKSFFFSNTENRINFKNGILDLASGELIAHSPDFGFRAVLPYDFDLSASCPTFDWWIDDIMLGDKELVAILQEFMGYVVKGGDYKYHKALWLAGTGRNGKSTFIDLLKALIGHDNYATLAIKQIIGDKFASSMLDGKIANFSEETSPEELADSGPFKNLTGDGEVNAQKKYGDPYQFRNRAKLIMSYNEVPQLKDLSPGMLSRPIIVPFKKDLTGEGAQDRKLKGKLLAELPGIFNFALAGWNRLEDQGDFTSSQKSDLELEDIRDASCTAAQWVKENVEFLGQETPQVISARDLYKEYKEDLGKYAYSEVKFHKRILAMEQIRSRHRRTNKGGQYFALRVNRAGNFSGDF